MSLALHYWIGDAHHCSGPPVSEVTCAVSSGTLNPSIPYHCLLFVVAIEQQQLESGIDGRRCLEVFPDKSFLIAAIIAHIQRFRIFDDDVCVKRWGAKLHVLYRQQYNDDRSQRNKIGWEWSEPVTWQQVAKAVNNRPTWLQRDQLCIA